MRQTKVNLIRGLVVKRRMASYEVIVLNPIGKSASQGLAVIKRMKVNELVFEGPPEPLHKDIVMAAASAIHADGNVVVVE